MQYAVYGTKVVVRIDKGEEIHAALADLCQRLDIRAAAVTAGIGALNKVSLGWFEQETKKYYTQEFAGSMEITSLAGNVSRMDGKPYLHLHVNLTDSSYKTFGGHMNFGQVGATCEVVLDMIDGQVERAWSEEIGLNLFKLE